MSVFRCPFSAINYTVVEPPRFATVFATPGFNFFLLKTLGIIFLSVNHPVSVVFNLTFTDFRKIIFPNNMRCCGFSSETKNKEML